MHEYYPLDIDSPGQRKHPKCSNDKEKLPRNHGAVTDKISTGKIKEKTPRRGHQDKGKIKVPRRGNHGAGKSSTGTDKGENCCNSMSKSLRNHSAGADKRVKSSTGMDKGENCGNGRSKSVKNHSAGADKKLQDVPSKQSPSGSTFSNQVKALLVKDLLLKKNRMLAACCEVFLFPVVIALYLTLSLDGSNLTSWNLSGNTVVINSKGTSNIVHPFPIECTPVKSNGSSTLFQGLFEYSMEHPRKSSRKKLAIGPRETAMRLKSYLENRTQAPHAIKEQYAALGNACANHMDASFSTCLKDQETACGNDRRLSRRYLNATLNSTVNTGSDHRLQTCAELVDCECAKNPQCGLSEKGDCGDMGTAGGKYHDIPCHRCTGDRPECTPSNIWENVGENLAMLSPEIVIFEDNEDFDHRASRDTSYCGGVFFDPANVGGYTLRLSLPDHTVWERFLLLFTETHLDISQYDSRLQFQRLIDNFIASENAEYKIDDREHELALSAFPSISNTDMSTTNIVHLFVFVLMTRATLFVEDSLREKEWKVKSAMHVHGVKLTAYYTSRSLFMCGWAALIVLLPALLLGFLPNALQSGAGSTNAPTFFLVFWLTLWSGFVFVSFLTTFFNKMYPALIVINGVVWALFLSLIVIPSGSRLWILFSVLFPFTNLYFTGYTTGALEKSLNANNFALSHRHFSLLDGVIMNLLGLMLWHLLFIYFDMVLQEGSPYAWYFPLTPRFWCSCLLKPRLNSSLPKNHEGTKRLVFQPATPLETEAQQAHRVLTLSNVTKRYANFTAVNSINATIYAGEIFSLLGQNGVGKTTTLSMISGMTSADGGSINIFGRNLTDYLKHHRNKVGLCLQQNLIWPVLTVEQHLRLFRSFKGVAGADPGFDSVLAMLGLRDKKKALVSTLSGGMVRKLCLAFSLLGDPELLLLDEPTSGLDPTERREVWDLLLSRKHNRIIIMSTHDMEEADALGDRVAIMNHGRIECNGSPQFLKKEYGCGYNITCLMKPRAHDIEKDKQALYNLIAGRCKSQVQVLTNVGREVTFAVSFSAAKCFPLLFADLDIKETSHVESYSVGVSNLEEVFLKVASNYDKKQGGDAISNIARKAGNMSGVGGIAKKAAFLSQLRACLVNRIHYSQRRWIIDLVTCLLPAVLLLFTFLVSSGNIFGLSQRSVSVSLTLSSGFPLYIPTDPTILAAGTSTSELLLEQDTYAKAVLDASRDSEFHMTSAVENLSQANATEWNVSASGPRCWSSSTQHVTNIQAMASVLKSEDKMRYVAFIFPETTADKFAMSAMVDLRSNISPFIAQNMYTNILLRAKNQTGRIKTSVQGLPRSQVDATMAPPVVFAVAVGVTSLFFINLVLVEKDGGILSYQTSVGLRMAPYWVAHWIFDGFTHVVAVFLVVGVFYALDKTEFVGTEHNQQAYTIILLVLFAIAQPWYCYSICSIFRTSRNVGTFFVITLSVQFPAVVASGVVKLGFDIPWLALIVDIFKNVRRLSPSSVAADGLTDLYVVATQLSKTQASGKRPECSKSVGNSELKCATSVWDIQDGPGLNLVLMGLHVVLWPVFLLFLWKLRRSAWWNGYRGVKVGPVEQNWDKMKDEDVRAEESRVATMKKGGKDNAIFAQNIRKVFKSSGTYIHAVQGISFAANVGEVFALLGVNGAGKSTLLKILAGEEVPLKGETAYHRGKSVLKVQRECGVGYCPQNDPLWPCLTVRDHLTFACRIKGIASGTIPRVTTDLLRALDLLTYADVQSERLSGGNKRKLSVAMSLVGTPRILFLDQPSAGVDPLSRRFIWGVIQQVAERDKSTAVILTTHSMEECEAICTRTAIMVNGVFRCMGPNSHIRNAYGKGLTVDVCFDPAKHTQSHSELLKLWRLSSKTRVVTYKQLHAATNSGQYPLHNRMLLGKASCFAAVRGLLMQMKNLDMQASGIREVVENGVCATTIAAEWWHNVYLCDAFIQKMQKRLGKASIECEEIHGQTCRLGVIGEKKSAVASLMESLKQSGDVNEYTLSKTSLETIFNRFAREPLNNTSG